MVSGRIVPILGLFGKGGDDRTGKLEHDLREEKSMTGAYAAANGAKKKVYRH